MIDKIKSIFLAALLLHFVHVMRTQIVFTVNEEQPAPVFLGNIAIEARITSIPDLDFSLLVRKDLFDVDETNGDFRIRTTLDREHLCGSVPNCILSTSVAVSSAPDFFQRYSVNVVILDINDQKPNFGVASFPRSISERADINTTIKLPIAYDGDYEPAFKVQRYHLEPDLHKTFDLIVQRRNKSDGSAEFDLHLRLLKKIDRETIGSYTLTLVASDGGVPKKEGQLRIVVSVTDENDNKPEFQKQEYEAYVKEITPVGDILLTVTAHDADDIENGRVGYEFSSDVDRKVLDYFEFVGVSGDMKLVRSLEKEGGSKFIFKIRAFDHGTPMMFSEATVTVIVEDTVNNPPSISISHWRSKNDSAVVSEDAVVGTKVALIDVLDMDSGYNGQTACSASDEYFSLEEYNSSPVEYTVSVVKELDREKTNSHIITITCSDNGTPPLSTTANLSVLVDDVNDNKPVFNKRSYDLKIHENQEIGKLVGSVSATDIDDGLNALIHYSLEPIIFDFQINKLNGHIYTGKKLDRETTQKYIFKVFAFDVGLFPLTATATVTVNIEDVNDESPKFDNSTYTFSVSELSNSNSIIGQVRATDLDLGPGGTVEYLLIYSPHHPDPPFTLSKEDGTLFLNHHLDYEATKLYNFIVTAVDKGNPPRNSYVEAHIHVLDENDNTPLIIFPSKDNLSVTLNLEAVPGDEVIKIIAHDADDGENGRLIYSLRAANSRTAKLFWINEDTGLLTLAAPLTETNIRSYNFTISVSDNGFPERSAHAVLQIDIVHQVEEKHSRESYSVIVISMVCVTLFIAVSVLTTLCFIKYIDTKKWYCDTKVSKSIFKPINPEHFLQEIRDKCETNHKLETGPSIQRRTLSYNSKNHRSINKSRSNKKSVTFDNEVRSSDISSTTDFDSFHQTDPNFTRGVSSLNTPSSPRVVYDSFIPRTFHPVDSYNTPHSTTTYRPSYTYSTPSTSSSLPSCYLTNSNNHLNRLDSPTNLSTRHQDGGESMATADDMVDAALQKHKALVRMMALHDKSPANDRKKLCPNTEGHDLDICSSSSVETSDSGNGGSEQDISDLKAGV